MILDLQKLRIKPSDSTFIIDDTLKDFNLNFKIRFDNQFLNLAHGCKDDIVIIRKFDINNISIISQLCSRHCKSCYQISYWKNDMLYE